MSDNDSNPIDYGPLTRLIGNWKGEQGLDLAPEPEGSEENPYFETLSFEAIGNATNAEEQTLAVLRYQQIVTRKLDGEVFHDQTGYWMWDATNQIIMQSLSIPRAVCVLAGGKYEASGAADEVILEVSAKLGDPDWGVLQSPFMRDKASTLEFQHRISVSENRLAYTETTVLDIYGKRFDHIDKNELVRCQ